MLRFNWWCFTYVSNVSAIYWLKNSRGIKKGDSTTLQTCKKVALGMIQHNFIVIVINVYRLLNISPSSLRVGADSVRPSCSDFLRNILQYSVFHARSFIAHAIITNCLSSIHVLKKWWVNLWHLIEHYGGSWSM